MVPFFSRHPFLHAVSEKMVSQASNSDKNFSFPVGLTVVLKGFNPTYIYKMSRRVRRRALCLNTNVTEE